MGIAMSQIIAVSVPTDREPSKNDGTETIVYCLDRVRRARSETSCKFFLENSSEPICVQSGINAAGKSDMRD